MEKRLVFFRVSCGIGMESTSVENCTGMSDNDIDSLAWDLAVACAESYGTYYEDDYEAAESETDDIFCGDRNFTVDDLDNYWEDYIPEKHDMYRAGGGSFLDDQKE